MKQEHPHATFLRAIADGEPLENFQIRCENWCNEWREMYAGGSALFGDNVCEIRRKPRMIRIGDTEVQAGITEEPAHGAPTWIADPTSVTYARATGWGGGAHDRIHIKRGLIHLTQEPAVAMGKALAALTEHKNGKP